ncbi:MAG: hypothetical protein HY719_05315 [Planctomycetes bacterium]|nr:hypothetical protein [Planctomycetota bacterium]
MELNAPERTAPYRSYNLTCVKCGRYFSEDTLTCPHCGHDNYEGAGGPGRYPALWWAVVVVALAGIGAAAWYLTRGWYWWY